MFINSNLDQRKKLGLSSVGKPLEGNEYKAVFPPELEEMSRNILKKCEGLPLAIVAIGGLLTKKEKTGLEWKRVLERLATELNSDSNITRELP
jgi:hypothetical protein